MFPVLEIIDDIFFLAKVQETAKQASVELKTTRAADCSPDGVAQEKPTLVIIDLQAASADPAEVIRSLKNDRATKEIPLLAFGRHTQTDLIEAAQKAGADRVIPRSEFNANLSEILRGAAPAPRKE